MVAGLNTRAAGNAVPFTYRYLTFPVIRPINLIGCIYGADCNTFVAGLALLLNRKNFPRQKYPSTNGKGATT